MIERILHIATNPGDLVLDSFLGSGTTAAVAHKMGRRYIGIEMGEHAVTHCAPRLKKVIDGEQGGISEGVGWKGGGGFRFYRLGPPVFDEDGHIRPDISFPVLAAHIWFGETATPWTATRRTPFLGIHDGRAFALLYNGILGDKRPEGGNVLTRATLALIRAAIANDVQRVRQLIQLGAELELVDTRNRRSALAWASREGHELVVSVLLDGKYEGAGANIETRSLGDWTPLICASMGWHVDVVRVLLSRGANVAARDYGGDSAMSFATSPAMKALLKAHGADSADEDDEDD